MGKLDLPAEVSASAYNLPDTTGHFGPYGGTFVAETLIAALDELRDTYESLKDEPAFRAEFEYELKHYVGRPSPIFHARRLSEAARDRGNRCRPARRCHCNDRRPARHGMRRVHG